MRQECRDATGMSRPPFCLSALSSSDDGTDPLCGNGIRPPRRHGATCPKFSTPGIRRWQLRERVKKRISTRTWLCSSWNLSKNTRPSQTSSTRIFPLCRLKGPCAHVLRRGSGSLGAVGADGRRLRPPASPTDARCHCLIGSRALGGSWVVHSPTPNGGGFGALRRHIFLAPADSS